MENIHFKNLSFVICDGRIFLANVEGNLFPFVQVQVAGENKATGAKMIHTSEGDRLQYVAHELQENRLEIVQRSVLVETKTVFQGYDDTTAVRIHTEIKNISRLEIVLQEVSAFVYGGLGETSIDNSKKLYFTQFIQSHHAECQPRKKSFFDFGMHKGSFEQQKRISFANIGSWSTKASLPQGIIENSNKNTFLMYQIERNHSWYYEISDENDEYYLYLSGANETFGSWCKALQPQAIYTTPTVALAFADTENNVINEMTKYRRHISGKSAVDTYLPTIFNEYMHLSWDSPTAENTFQLATIVAKTGVEYYVIDCGWHNEEPGNIIYPFVGQWKESKARFPEGVRKTTDYIRSLGMKAGLWIEPEMISEKSELFEKHSDWAVQVKGRAPKLGRNQMALDFSNPEVINYIKGVFDNILGNHDISYVKWDCNRYLTENYSLKLSPDKQGEFTHRYILGLYEVLSYIRKKYPLVLIEGCAGGRFDAGMLCYTPQIWTSDATDADARTLIQYGTSVVYPPSTISAHVSDIPNVHTKRNIDLYTRANVASMGVYGYEMNFLELERIEELRGYTERYKSVRDIALTGDLFRLASPFDSNYFAFMILSKDKSEGYGVYYRSKTSYVNNQPHRIYLKGLDEKKVYEIPQRNIVASGSVLANLGITIDFCAIDHTSVYFDIKERK